MDTSTSITAPDSVFFRGQWHAATWLAEVVDESTGELIITATLAGAEREPVVTALRMDMDLARQLREMARNGAVAECYDCRTIEQRLDVLEAHAVETDDTLSILDGRVTNDAIAGVERLQALEKRWDFLSQQFLLVMQRVDAGLPGADYMREQYDAEHDAAPISYWDMKLLAMIETVNERLGVAVGGA